MVQEIGIDSPTRRFAGLYKVDILTLKEIACVEALQELAKAFFDIGIDPCLSDEAKAFENGSAVFGFSMSFFVSKSLDSKRFSNNVRFPGLRQKPRCLSVPTINGDGHFATIGTVESKVKQTSDLIILVEVDDKRLLERLVIWFDSRHDILSLRFHSFSEALRPFARNALGYNEGLSNLQDIRTDEPETYKQMVYVDSTREKNEHPAYNGGTYLVYRRYKLNTRNWFDPRISCQTKLGTKLYGERARNAIIGTTRSFPRDHVETPPMEQSHAYHANPRGHAVTKYGVTVSPRRLGILRRGFSERKIKECESDYYLNFICFQGNIQKTGFEFIHNEWLMSVGMLGNIDPLLNPRHKFVEPCDTCYYFVPRVQKWPGDVLFDEQPN